MTKSSEQARAAYLKRAFALNPVWQAPEVMELRSRALKVRRLNQTQLPQAEQSSQSREAAHAQISRMQREFWKLPLDQLRRQLEAMSAKSLPEFAPVVNRLKTAAMSRGEFPRLAQEPWMDGELFNAFKKAVVLPPSDASVYRERFMARIHDRKRLKTVKTSVKQLQARYPVLYALERDWFQTLMKHKVRHTASDDSGGTSFSLPEMEWPIVIVVFIVIRIVLRLMMTTGN